MTSRFSAPPVSYPVGRFVWEARVLWGVWVLALAAMTWSPVSQGLSNTLGPAGWAAVSTSLAGTGLLAVWLWRHLTAPSVGTLVWQSGLWAWSGSTGCGREAGADNNANALRVECILDLQSVLLVRLHGDEHAPRWLWLQRASNPARWDDLRRALWSHGVG